MGREAQQEKLGEAQRRGTGVGVRSSIPGRSEVWQASLGRWHSVFGLKVDRDCQETADGSGRQKGSERVSPACTARVSSTAHGTYTGISPVLLPPSSPEGW